MSSICIIGQGNVATHLCVAFAGTDNEVIQVNSRTLEDLPEDCDFYLLCVSDNAIEEVASRLPESLRGIVAHTSGTTPVETLRPYAKQYGVLYPLMTFSRDAEIDYSRIPFFPEGATAEIAESLKSLCLELSRYVTVMDSRQRMLMHVASVFTCNFTNYMWDIAYGLMKERDVPFRYMLPMIEAALQKLQYMSPRQAQTGPASRGDTKTIEAHRELLREKDPKLADLYSQISAMIQETHSK